MSKPMIDKIALLKLTRDKNLKKCRRKVQYLPAMRRIRNKRARKVVSQDQKMRINKSRKRWRVKARERKRERRCNHKGKMKSKNKTKRNPKSKLSPKNTAQPMEEEISIPTTKS